VVVTARGSARVKLGGSCVLAAVSIELFTPDAAKPNAGKLTCSVDCTANASDEFEGKGAEIKNAQLTSDLERVLIESKCVDLSKLVVVAGTACWNVSIDALVTDSGGNILDTICLAARAALSNTIIPRMEVTYNEDGVAEIGDVDDDPTAGDPFPIESVPICVSIAKVILLANQ
jgi:exosome complex component RRP42